MSDRLTFDQVSALLQTLPLSAELIAIDGLPLAGKSTLAAQLVEEFGFGLVGVDDFVAPHEDWPSDIKPAYPFPFSRWEEFRTAVRALRNEGQCFYYPFDWEIGFVSPEPRYVVRDKPIIIEGAGALDPELVACFDLKFFVESDEATLMPARMARDGDVRTEDWTNLYLPSDALYMATKPQDRADFLVAGRGIA